MEKPSPIKSSKLQNRIQILCTRPIEPSQIHLAKEYGIDIDCLSFIDTVPIASKEVIAEIKDALKRPATVVFTSMNAVDAVAAQMQKDRPNWRIYCIGITTNKLVKKYFGEHALMGTAINAKELAGLIVAEKSCSQLHFFCGNQRRDELPGILRGNGIRVNEITVYQTKQVNHAVTKKYDGILFFSPSGVDSYFQSNVANPESILFAIGQTTAGAIQNHSNNNIVISDLPGKENLVNRMIECFNTTI